MRILQSKGRSFTTFSAESIGMTRGLEPDDTQSAAKWLDEGEKRIAPVRIPVFLKEDPDLIIRQVVSVLDKVIRKTKILRDLPLQTYVDRTLLAEELWQRITDRIRQSHDGEITPADLDAYKSRWSWKVHPYAKNPPDPSNPKGDQNAVLILKNGDRLPSPTDSRGRWHGALWKTTSDGDPDYASTANAIINHIFSNEVLIGGHYLSDWSGKGSKSSVGLAERRGDSIRSSTPDLKLPIGPGASARLLLDLDDQNAKPIIKLFFHQDIAAKIYAFVLERARVDGPRKPNVAFSVRSSDFGRLLSKHFGDVPNHRDFDDETKIKIVAFYDRVKRYYAALSKSESFRRAIAKAEISKLEAILPRDKSHLLAVLAGKERNTEISSLIRFGKLVGHACDISPVVEVQTAFDNNVRHLATSDGQSEIKRNENFTRVWRTSVAFSLRTLDSWLKPDWPKLTEDEARRRNDRNPGGQQINKSALERDIAQMRYIKTIAGEEPVEGFLNGAGIIFGSKHVEFEGEAARRCEIFAQGDKAKNRELVWAWLRLAAEMRHRTNHFSTKPRLVSLMQKGVLSPTRDNPGNFENRKGNEVQQAALDAFGQLLSFDINYQAILLVNDFNRLQVTRYTSDGQFKDVLRRALSTDDDPVITTPKFMSVLRKAKGIFDHDLESAPEWSKFLGSLDLTALSAAPDGPNQFKIGLLRHLFATDFQSWLARKANTKDQIQAAVVAVSEDKNRRTLDVLKNEESRVYAVAETAAKMLIFAKADSFSELAALVMSMAFAEDNTRKSYKPKPEEQSKRSTWVDDFQRDLFVYLFNHYLNTQSLHWIFDVTDLVGDGEARTVTLFDLGAGRWSLESKPWHSQFYAWLYLTPVDEVALLRNQMRRMLILEKKGGSNETPALRDLDRLMTLYIAVSSAGFDGTEHIQTTAEDDKRFRLYGGLLYEDAVQFEKVYSAAADTNDQSLPGTRRGLRQIARLGHISVLKGIFEKHLITPDEVSTLIETKKAKSFKDATKRAKLHNEIVTLSKGFKPDIHQLDKKCKEYKDLSAEITVHNFKAAGARLTEHARLHQLLMRVISRLADFTLIWERDRNYVLLALIYPKLLHPDENAPRLHRRDGKVGFLLPPETTKTMRAAHAPLSDNDKRKLSREIALTSENVEEGFLPLWDDDMGYRLTGYPIHLALLEMDKRDAFARFFDRSETENPLDVAERARIKRGTGNSSPLQRRQLTFKDGKRRIRNDFAHFNVIVSDRKRVSLTYLMNAVRSLVAYDRKLKNAVSKAVADILVDEGLDISWEMTGDRLRNPVVVPRLETNLKKVRKHRGLADPQFVLPLASVRYTSMVKALFDFQAGGYRKEIIVGQETKQRGELGYPVELRVLLGSLGADMPDDVLGMKLYVIQPQK